MDRLAGRRISKCFHFAIHGPFPYSSPVKKTPLTIRRCSPELHQAIKQSAALHHRSMNGETLTWLERQAGQQKVCTGKEAAAALRRFAKMTTAKERRQMADAIEEARRRMAHEHLH